MSKDYGRMIGMQINGMRHSLGALVGIAQGMLCDEVLTDDEIQFLKSWLEQNQQLSWVFPGDVIYDEVKKALGDGVITDDERSHLVKTLQDLIGAPERDLASRAHVTELAYDSIDKIHFRTNKFCLTGDFIHGPRRRCETEIRDRGGLISSGVTKSINYLVVGSLGSIEWKHGSFGTKIERAMHYKKSEVPISIVQENIWRAALE